MVNITPLIYEHLCDKSIFIYANVYNIIICLFNIDRLPWVHLRNRLIIKPKNIKELQSLNCYLDKNVDWFQIKEQIDN